MTTSTALLAKRSVAAVSLLLLAAACSDGATAPSAEARDAGDAPSARAFLVSATHASISSLTVSPDDLASGGYALGTANVEQGTSRGSLDVLSVRLSSSNPLVATVPSSAAVSSLTSRATFKVLAAGSTGGCSNITASIGSKLDGTFSSRSAVVYVQPAEVSSPLDLELQGNTMLGWAGSDVTGRLSLVLMPSDVTSGGSRRVVSLSSSNPLVTVPASVTIQTQPVEGGPYVGAAQFPVVLTQNVSTYSCSVITASAPGMPAVRALLKIYPDYLIGG